MHLKTRLLTYVACLFAIVANQPTAASAQSYPNKPITLVVPFSPGSGTDQVARGMAQVIASAFNGATVVVDNKPGASGMIAAQAVAKAPADGYTLFMTTNTTQSANPHLFKKLSYDPVADFTPIAAIARGSMVLVLPGSSPIKSVAEFIAAAKSKSLTFGAGNSSSRVAAEMFSQMTGVKTLYVPYKSNPQSVTDLVGGQLDFMFADTATALPLVQAGKLKALAYAGDKRSATLPNLPTLNEAGVKGYELYYWVAIYGPKGMAPDLVRRLNEVFVKGVQADVITAVYAHAVLDPYTTTPEGLAQFQRSETEKWGRVIKAAGIEAE
jgi:tripartite-type tricarboxylate transporter receptor subunit TctC